MSVLAPRSADSAQRAQQDACAAYAPDAKPVVFIVDDDASVCESLELLAESAGWQAESFGCAQEFLASMRPHGPSCLVLDVRLPGLDGLDLQDLVSADRTDMPIIFITGHGDVPMTVRAMKGGAVDFLTKPFRGDALLDAISRALERSRAVLERLAEMRELRGRYGCLTPRERDVMALVVVGKLNKQVAADLGISEITVKAHRGKVMRKMQARSLPQLVNLAARLSVGSAVQEH